MNVSVSVTNTGPRPGEEVVQLYVSLTNRQVPVPLRSLQGVQRIRLEPGESRKVDFTLAPEQFSALDALMQRCVEPGTVSVSIGGGQPSDEIIQAKKVIRKELVLTGKKWFVR
ncbi:Thermostable beta-glucosidase B [bioreactor metagenome]|uniref:Thermostable beta-glucosidase B n=1 Tax=bioreactor metagenome TaxID=1076179 RepID=A0A645JJG5_9ZZZZ